MTSSLETKIKLTKKVNWQVKKNCTAVRSGILSLSANKAAGRQDHLVVEVPPKSKG